MSRNLDDQIRLIADALVADLPDADARTIMDGGDEVVLVADPSMGRRRIPRWVIPAFTALLVAMITGLAVLVEGSRADDVADTITPSSEPSIATTVPGHEEESAPETTMSSESAAPITGMSWQRLNLEEIDPPGDGGTLLSGGDRFIYIDRLRGTISASRDGVEWVTTVLDLSPDEAPDVAWHGRFIGSGCGGSTQMGSPEVGPIIPSPGCAAVTEGPVQLDTDLTFTAHAVSPVGYVLVGWELRDENGNFYIFDLPDLVWNLGGYDWDEVGRIDYADGVLSVETPDGPREYVLADHGYAYWPEDRTQSAWFSRNGVDWTPITEFPSGVDWSVIGTDWGFFAVSDDRNGSQAVHHSPDGLTWNEVRGQLDMNSTLPDLRRWREGALILGEQWVWQATESEATPVLSWGPETAGGGVNELGFDAGAIGLVRVGDGSVHYSPDLEEWLDVTPPELRDIFGDGLAWPMFQTPVEVAVTDTAVLIRLALQGEPDSFESAWFLGTLQTG